MDGVRELRFFKAINDYEGTLAVIEKNENLPFLVKRIFYIYGVPNRCIRGKHAHKELQQILFCPSGSCDFTLDDGSMKKTIRIESADHAIHISGCLWLEFTNFSADCVVMSLSSAEYDEADYIRDYGDFLEFVGKG